MNWLKEKLRAWLEVPSPHTTPEVQAMIERAEAALWVQLREAKAAIRTDQMNGLYSAMEANAKFDALAKVFGAVVVAQTDGRAEILPGDKRELGRTQKVLAAEMELREMRRLRNLTLEAFERTGEAITRVAWGKGAESAVEKAMAQAAKMREGDRYAH
jgi:hypothetical protein